MATVATPRKNTPHTCPCGITISRSRDLDKHKRTGGHIQFIKTGELNRPGKPNLLKDKDGKHHAHYWSIEAANGPLSPGTCKLCGKVQRFTNSLMNQGDWFRSGDDDTRNDEERSKMTA